jgi:C_GCAxxG_C_C family probable redox protein
LEQLVRDRVRHLYWTHDINCAGTSLRCLAELFQLDLTQQTLHAAIGLHGAGGYRAQCGLVEGPLMFLGIFLSGKGKSETEIADVCFQFAQAFEREFSSLRCYDLRPGGFSDDDPPHACETLTVHAILFAYRFIQSVA